DGQRNVLTDRPGDVELYRASNLGLESGLGNSDVVGPRLQGREAVIALAVRRCLELFIGSRPDEDDLGSRNNSTARITNSPYNASRADLRPCLDCDRQKDKSRA